MALLKTAHVVKGPPLRAGSGPRCKANYVGHASMAYMLYAAFVGEGANGRGAEQRNDYPSIMTRPSGHLPQLPQ